MKRVSGEMTIEWTAVLPDDAAPVACEDPAVEAAMGAVTQEVSVYLWGAHRAPAVVMLELQEEDVIIVEDERPGGNGEGTRQGGSHSSRPLTDPA